MSNSNLKDIFYEVREEVSKIVSEDEQDGFHTELYMIAQEACYGLSESELECLHQACLDILEDRRS